MRFSVVNQYSSIEDKYLKELESKEKKIKELEEKNKFKDR